MTEVDSKHLNNRRLYFPHKIQYDGKPLKECSQEELIEAICSAAQEIQDLKQVNTRQENLINFTLEMWKASDANKKKCSCHSKAAMQFMLKYLESSGT